MKAIDTLRVKLFADGADLSEMIAFAERPYVRGFTTNPTLMHKAGIRDYRQFAATVLDHIRNRPISFEVFSDDFDEMERQAREIAAWGPCVFVKIPVTNVHGDPSYALIRRLSQAGVRVNVTAILTLDQVERAAAALSGGAASNISIFAGRIADTGRDPMPIVAEAVRIAAASSPTTELIWASPRELLNVFQADTVGCHIITLTPEILRKLDFIGRDLGELSLATVKMFHEDARKAGLTFEGLS